MCREKQHYRHIYVRGYIYMYLYIPLFLSAWRKKKNPLAGTCEAEGKMDFPPPLPMVFGSGSVGTTFPAPCRDSPEYF